MRRLEEVELDNCQPERGLQLDSVYGVEAQLGNLLDLEDNAYDRHKAAISYAGLYHQDLEEITDKLDQKQLSAVIPAKAFLSSVSSTAQLYRFIAAGSILGRQDNYTQARKRIYLEAKKVFQDEIDDLFDYFQDESPAALSESLKEIVGLSRQLVRGNRMTDASSTMHVYLFLGSILAERAVKVSLQENIHAGTRYGTAAEDRSPHKADVVVPLKQGDMPIQVKMKMAEGATFDVRPLRKVPHVFVPQPKEIRTNLTPRENEMLALSIITATEEGQWTPLQTGVDELRLVA